MTARLETHLYFNGESWGIYTERHADIRRFTAWFGPPTRRGRQGACAGWDGIDPQAAAFRRRAKRKAGSISPTSLQALKEHRAAAQRGK